jgi:hypothetical protein
MLFLLEEGRFHDAFEDKPAKWLIAEKKHQNVHPQLIHDFARRSKKVWSLKKHNKIIYKVRKTTLEP